MLNRKFSLSNVERMKVEHKNFSLTALIRHVTSDKRERFPSNPLHAKSGGKNGKLKMLPQSTLEMKIVNVREE